MIILQRLRVPALKHLRDIDLWFPRTGSILFEGQNESGKSTLFEALYFALYGTPLVGEKRPATLDDLLPHSGGPASVELSLLVDATRLDIQRTLTRGNGTQRASQKARLSVSVPGADVETIHGAAPVAARILQELGGLDGDALRNSCFMEQKALDRVEALSRDDREKAMAKLLGLERLRRVEDELKARSVQSTRQLERARAEAHAAQLWQASERAAAEVSAATVRRDAARVRNLLAQRDATTDAQARLLHDASQMTSQQAALSAQVHRVRSVQTLRDDVGQLGPRLAAAQVAADAAAGVQGALAEIDRIERDDLPPLDARLAQVRAAEHELHTLDADREQLGRAESVLRSAAEVEQTQAALHEAQAELGVAARAESRHTLTTWLRLKQVQALATDGEASVAVATKQHAAAEHGRASASTAARRALLLTIIVATVALLAAGLGVVWHPAWLLALVLLVSVGVLTRQTLRARMRLQGAQAEYAQTAQQVATVRAEHSAAQRFATAVADLPRLESDLRAAGLVVPSSIVAGEAMLAAMSEMSQQNAASQIDAPSGARVRQATIVVAQRESDVVAAQRRLAAARSTFTANHGAEDATPPQPSAAWLAEQRAVREQRERRLLQQLAALGIRADAASRASALAAARGGTEANIAQLRARMDERPHLLTQHAQQAAEAERLRVEIAVSLASRWQQAQIANTTATPPASASADLATLTQSFTLLQREVVAELASLNEGAALAQHATLAERERGLRSTHSQAEASHADLAAQIRALFGAYGVECSGTEPLADLVARWQPLAASAEADETSLDEAVRTATVAAHVARASAMQQAQSLGVDVESLNVAATAATAAAAERQQRRYELAREMAQQVRERIVRRVLPETEVYMRALLPELTAGRYRDARLLADEGGSVGADLRIALWDEVAGRHVAKNLFSGGTRDQCSLALRLAFALATLPKEMGAMPGFIFLDEPLSSFDAERSHALVDVVTQGVIARHFAQVLLISHSRSVERERFQYHVEMAGGRVLSSNLPSEREARQQWTSAPHVTASHA